MRKYLISNEGNFYKANMHCHSTVSDGSMSPAELKEYYKKEGYNIIAYTDHELLQDHSDLNDEDFLAITGYEISFCEVNDREWVYKKNCHLNAYAKEPDNTKIVNFHPSNFWLCGPETYEKQEYYGEPRPKEYSVEGVNYVISEALKHGFIVSYNHPVWSCEDYNDYTNYRGCFAMEIYNYGSDIMSGCDFVPVIYDEMLRKNGKLFAINGDDNHNKGMQDSFGAQTMIKADKLEYHEIIKSLETGNFYTKMRYSPELKEIYAEDGKVHLTFENARDVYMRTAARVFKGIHGTEEEPLTKAEFKVDSLFGYVRFDIVGFDGSHTTTNAYFVDGIL